MTICARLVRWLVVVVVVVVVVVAAEMDLDMAAANAAADRGAAGAAAAAVSVDKDVNGGAADAVTVVAAGENDDSDKESEPAMGSTNAKAQAITALRWPLYTHSTMPVCTDHSVHVPSSHADSRYCPHGEKQMACTPKCGCRRPSSSNGDPSLHSAIVPSLEHDPMVAPSGENAQPTIQSAWLLNVRSRRPLDVHTRMDNEHDKMCCPSGEIAHERILPPCFPSCASLSPLVLHTTTRPSAVPVTAVLP